MNNSPINSTINSTTVGELADATSLRMQNLAYKVGHKIFGLFHLNMVLI